MSDYKVIEINQYDDSLTYFALFLDCGPITLR